MVGCFHDLLIFVVNLELVNWEIEFSYCDILEAISIFLCDDGSQKSIILILKKHGEKVENRGKSQGMEVWQLCKI